MYEKSLLEAVYREDRQSGWVVTITPGIIYHETDKGVVLIVEDVTENG